MSGCDEHYIGRTDCCLIIRLQENSERKDQPMYGNLANWEYIHEVSPFCSWQIPQFSQNVDFRTIFDLVLREGFQFDVLGIKL